MRVAELWRYTAQIAHSRPRAAATRYPERGAD